MAEKRITTKKIRDPAKLCGILTVAALLLFLIAGTVSSGDSFFTNFGADARDTGMDFFNSLAEAASGEPYTQFKTLYPPLANLLFFLLGKSVPEDVSSKWASTHGAVVAMRGTANDLRTHQAPMVLFLFFILISVIALYMLVEYIGKDNSRGKWLAFSSVFSFGVLFAYERGNIIVLTLALTLFFVFFHNSANSAVVRELALVALALAAGLKIYPALFGLILLKERDWKKAARTIIYGIACFILPFFAFDGLAGMRIFFGQLVRMTTGADALYGSIGIQGILMATFKCLKRVFDVPYILQDAITWTVKLLSAVILVVSFFLSKDKWRQYLDLTLMLVLFQTSYFYTLSFFLIPFIAYCKENPSINKHNAAALVFFMIVLLPYPAFVVYKVYTTRHLLAALAMGSVVIAAAVRTLRALLDASTKNVIKN